MPASTRKTPTTLNFGPTISEVTYSDSVNDEVVGLWKHVAEWLTNIGGTPNAITAQTDSAVVSPITVYDRPKAFWLVPTAANTGATTINVDGVGVKNIFRRDGTALQANDLSASKLTLIVYDGNDFRMLTDPPPTASTPGLVFIASSGSLAGLSQFDFVHGTAGVVFDDTYDEYLWLCSSIEFNTDNVGLELRVATSGPTFRAAATDYQYVIQHAVSSAAQAVSGSGAVDSMIISAQGSGVGNAAGENMRAEIRVANPESTSTTKLFSWQYALTDLTAGTLRMGNGAGVYDGGAADTQAIIGVRFLPQAGTFQAGTIRMYGIRKS